MEFHQYEILQDFLFTKHSVPPDGISSYSAEFRTKKREKLDEILWTKDYVINQEAKKICTLLALDKICVILIPIFWPSEYCVENGA